MQGSIRRFEQESPLGLADPKLCIVYVDPTPESTKEDDENIAMGWQTAPKEHHEFAHIADVKTNGLDEFLRVGNRQHQTQEDIYAASNVSLFAMKAIDNDVKEVPNNGAEFKAEYLGGKVYSGLNYPEESNQYYRDLGGPQINMGLNL